MRSTDRAGLYTEKPLTIAVTSRPEHRVVVWDSAGDDHTASPDAKWQTARNWGGDVAPSPGDYLVFPAGVSVVDTVNDFPAGTTFGQILVRGPGYTLGGNGIRLEGGIDTGGSRTTVNMGPTLLADQTMRDKGSLTLNGAVDLRSHVLTFDTDVGSTTTVNGQVGGSGDLVKQGGGSVVLASANTYTGQTRFAGSWGGMLFLRDSQALGAADGTAATGTTLDTGVYLVLESGVAVSGELLTVGRGILWGAGENGNTWGGDLTLDNSVWSNCSLQGTLSINGQVRGNGGLLVDGNVVVSADNTYTGQTHIGGQLVVNGTLPNSEIQFESGAVLAGTGGVGDVEAGQGTIAPGSLGGAGILHSGSLSFAGDIAVDVNGDTPGNGADNYDQLQVTGSVSLAGTLSVSVDEDYTPPIGQQFKIVDNDGSDSIAGTFTGLPEGSLLKVGSVVFRISYAGGDGNDLVLTTELERVTIEQAQGQADPTKEGPINFAVVFREPVSDFAAEDVTVSGTAGATTAVVNDSGTTYNVAVSGMARDGTVIASVQAGATHDGTGNPYPASVSTDNSVTYDTTPPTVSSLWPMDDAAGAPTDTSLVMTFGGPIQKGTGEIVLRRTTDNAVVETIDVAGGRVDVWDATVTIVPAATLTPLTGYYVEAAAGTFKDLAGNGFAGLSGAAAWNFTTESFRVTGLLPTVSGFVATFNAPLDMNVLNLYDGAGGALGAADVTVLDGAGQTLVGSLVVDSSRRSVEWVATGNVLPPGTYAVALKSGAAGLGDIAGNLLDGDADGTSGGDFVSSLTVLATPNRVLSVPDFARGAGQPVNVPNAAAGLPIRLDYAAGITSLAVDLTYDQDLLAITAAALAGGLPRDWSVAPPDTSTPGVAKIRAFGTTPLSGTNVDVVRLTAAVPGDVPYGAVQAIRLENVALNDGAIAAVGDVAVHKAAYLGDADGSEIHSSADAFLTVQAALGLASGFAAHAWADPRIVGDADGSGVLSAADAFLIVQEGLGLSEPFVPDNPQIDVTPVGGGVDPQFQIGVNLPPSAGGLVTVPVRLAIEPAATNVGALEFDLFLDASRLTIQVPGGISAGADTALDWAVASTLVAAGHVRVAMWNAQAQPLATGLPEIARLQFVVDAAAAPGLAPLELQPVDPHAGGYTWTAADGSVAIGAPNAWHNAAYPFEVIGDGAVTPLDVPAWRSRRVQGEICVLAASVEQPFVRKITAASGPSTLAATGGQELRGRLSASASVPRLPTDAVLSQPDGLTRLGELDDVLDVLANDEREGRLCSRR